MAKNPSSKQETGYSVTMALTSRHSSVQKGILIFQ